MIKSGNTTYNNIKVGTTEVKKVYRGTTLVYQKITSFSNTGSFISNGYLTNSAACNDLGKMTIINDCYTESGTIKTGDLISFTNNDTMLLAEFSKGYFIVDGMQIIEVTYGRITDIHVLCPF